MSTWSASLDTGTLTMDAPTDADKAIRSESCVLWPATQASVGVVTRMRTDSVRSSIPVVSRSSNPLDDDDDDEY